VRVRQHHVGRPFGEDDQDVYLGRESGPHSGVSR
jgi:hypothetical protein